MQKNNETDAQDPFAPDLEPDREAAGQRRRGHISGYFRIAIILGIILWVTDFLILFLDLQAFTAASAACLIYTCVMAAAFINSRAIHMKELAAYVEEFHTLEDLLLQELDMPYALLDEGGHIIWMNPAFEKAVHKDRSYRRPISTLIPVLTRDVFPTDDKLVKVPVELVGNSYSAQMRRIQASHLSGDSDILSGHMGSKSIISLNLVDNTAVQLAIQEVDDQSLAVGLFYIDNYDEVIDTVEEVRKALLIALIDRKVNQYISSIDGLCSKIEKDKYLIILRKKSLQGLQDGHFDILEDVKKVSVGNEMAVTLSLGFGLDGLAYTQNYEFARNAVDLALGRGGDQAVVKSPDNVVYYGGKTRQVEKNTRVKARVKAQALNGQLRCRRRYLQDRKNPWEAGPHYHQRAHNLHRADPASV